MVLELAEKPLGLGVVRESLIADTVEVGIVQPDAVIFAGSLALFAFVVGFSELGFHGLKSDCFCVRRFGELAVLPVSCKRKGDG